MPQCPLCHHNTSRGQYFCPPCTRIFRFLRRDLNYCRHCGTALAAGTICGSCLNSSSRLEAFWAGFHYRPPLSTLIQKWKFTPRLQYSGALAHLLLSHPPPWLQETQKRPAFSFMLAMPTTDESFSTRLFNPALELARGASKKYNIPLLGRNQCTKKNLRPQHELTEKERFINIKGAFAVHSRLTPGPILLIDDVATTRATLTELARTLKKINNDPIYAWVLAH